MAIADDAKPEIEIVSTSQPEVVLKENGRAKFTINLQTIFKNNAKEEVKESEEIQPANTRPDKPVSAEALRQVWEEFAALHKNQIAEYQLLKRDYLFKDNIITIPLSNSIEEPLLHNIRLYMTTYFRDKLDNNSISVLGVLQEIESKKAIYTNKEKFDHLAEKNPLLRELKERLGLDTDY